MPPVAEFVMELALREAAAQLAQADSHRAGLADEFGERPSLADTVVKLGFVSESNLCDLLGTELSMPVVALGNRRVGGEILAVLSREQVLKYGVMPLALADGRIELAVVDPIDLDALDELGHVIGLSVNPVLAPKSEILAAIDRHFGGGADDVAIEALGDAVAAATDEISSENEPVIRLLNSILAEAVHQRASDVHLEPLERRFRVRYRVDGKLCEVEGPAKRLLQDGRIEGRSIDLRVSTVPTSHGESIVMRLLDSEGLKPDLGDLGLIESDVQTLREITRLSDGMVLVSGSTGSGKTTTLYSCLQEIN